MIKKEIDRHVDAPQVSFTFLVERSDMQAATAIAKREDRTRGSVVREALRRFLDTRRKA